MPAYNLINRNQFLNNIDKTLDTINGIRKGIWKSFNVKQSCYLGGNAFSNCIKPFCGPYANIVYIPSAVGADACCPIWTCEAKTKAKQV